MKKGEGERGGSLPLALSLSDGMDAVKIYFEAMSTGSYVVAAVCLYYGKWDKAILFYLLGFRFEWKGSEHEQREVAKQFTHQRVKRATTT